MRLSPPALWSSLAVCVVLMSGAASGQSAPSAEPLRSWTVQDSVATRYFVGNLSAPGYMLDPPVVQPSPDGRHFFFIHRHGDLSCDCTEYVMEVFSTEAVREQLAQQQGSDHAVSSPLRRVVFRSDRASDLQQVFKQTVWEDDARILMLGIQEKKGLRRVYRLDVRSGALTALTDPRHDVHYFYRQGDTLVYGALTIEPPPPAYPVVDLLTENAPDFLNRGHLVTLYAQKGAGAAWKIGSHWDSGALAEKPSAISPDGRWAVLVTGPEGPNAPVPGGWSRYRWAQVAPRLLEVRFVLVDLEHHRTMPMLDAPVGNWFGHWPYAVWSGDSRHVFLVNTALPLTEDVDARRGVGYLVDYEAETGRWSVVEPMSGSAAGAPRKIVAVRYRGGPKGMPQVIHAGDSVPEIESSFADGLSVAARESANDPPVMWATDGKNSIALTEPDPSLNGIWRAPVQIVSWREKDGREISGGLMLPRDFSKSHPVPLVIEASLWNPGLFRPAGSAVNGFAGQALVSQGIAVLGLDIPGAAPGDDLFKMTNNPQEGDYFVERLDAAVAQLAAQGYIDPRRVGLVGFSHTALLTMHAIANPGRTALAAAVAANGYSYTFSEYLTAVAAPDLWRDGGSIKVGGKEAGRERFQGGSFWQSPALWLQRDPLFNANRGTAALLMTVMFPSEALPWVGAFRLNHRPIEAAQITNASHQLQLPRQWEASMQMTVDWMRFWLLNQEDTSPDKALRYARWRQMREENVTRLAHQH